MDLPAGKIETDDSSLTPWESIDPDEPTGGPAPLLPGEDDLDIIAPYHMEKTAVLAESPAGQPGPQRASDMPEPVAAPAPDEAPGSTTVFNDGDHATLALAVVPELPPVPADPIAAAAGGLASFDNQATMTLCDPGAVQPATPYCTLTPAIEDHAASLELPEEAISDESSILLPIDELSIVPRAQAPAKDTIVIHDEPVLSAEEIAGPITEGAVVLSESPLPETPEMFGDTIEALDAMPDTMGAIGDITEVVGEEAVPHPVLLQHIGPSFDSSTAAPEPDWMEPEAVPKLQTEAIGKVKRALSRAFEEADEAPPLKEFEAQPATRDVFDEVAETFEDKEEEELVEAVFTDDQPEPRWEDPELDGELEPANGTSAWTIPLLCVGIALIACCIVIPQADANRRMAYEKITLNSDLELIQKQVSVNDEFLKRIVDDPSLAERLAQRQLKRIRKGQRVLKMREEKTEMSPFQITAVTPPPAAAPYKPLGGTIANVCSSARNRLYVIGSALVMIACGLVMDLSPNRQNAPRAKG